MTSFLDKWTDGGNGIGCPHGIYRDRYCPDCEEADEPARPIRGNSVTCEHGRYRDSYCSQCEFDS